MKYGMLFLLIVLSGCVSTRGASVGEERSQERASAKVHTELAGMYYQRAQIGIALNEVDVAIKTDGNYAPAYNMRGLIRMNLREDKEADEDFKQSLRLEPNDSETHNNYGWFLCQRGRPAESIPHFLVALKNPLYTTPERAYLNAGVCSQKAGNYSEAQDFLQKSLTVRPGLPAALLGMAEVSFAQGAFHTAKRYFGEYSAAGGDLSAANLLLAARIERGVGDSSSAIRYAEQLRTHFPDSTEAHLLDSLKL
ncbi:MAG: type IV pilus biogenesis/stability protein PilW [Gallionella sp.]|nr:type IV pilus biogenesis/stability protein PilW [Gallionella sp.]MDD4958675.1 type IV pilus biogenesis/stability protein PilW [Gallionella sp.]